MAKPKAVVYSEKKNTVTVDFEAGLSDEDKEYLNLLMARGVKLKRKVHRKTKKDQPNKGRIQKKEYYLDNLPEDEKKVFEKMLKDGVHYSKCAQYANKVLSN